MDEVRKGDALAAAREWLLRSRGISHPVGRRNSAGRWYPAACEEAECCAKIRWPSRAWPNSLWNHCKTQKHIRTLYGVSPKAFKRALALVLLSEGGESRADLG